MKKVKLLVFPLIGLLLSSCASTIKGSEMPELSENPGYLLKSSTKITGSGDEELLNDTSFSQGTAEVTFEFYTNFVKVETKYNLKISKMTLINYYMLKDGVFYSLEDRDGVKSKTEENDPAGTYFENNAKAVMNSGNLGLSSARQIYQQMANIEQLNKEADEGETFKLKQLGYIYTLKTTMNNEYGVYNMTYKLKIKNNYFKYLEFVGNVSVDNKKIEAKAAYNFTFGAEKQAYDISKMPNPADYA